MPYVNQRWLGGLLTNFQTISKRITRLHELRDWTESGTMDLLPVRERIAAMHERDKLETNLGGVADMQRPPDAMFVVDLEDRGDRRARGHAPEDPDHRARRHELRPRPGRLRDPRQRRRDPLLQGHDRGDRRRGGRARARSSAPRRRPPGASARSRSAARPRSAPQREAEERERQRGRGARPPRGRGGRLLARRARHARAARGRRPPAAPARRASAARSIPTTIPRGAGS